MEVGARARARARARAMAMVAFVEDVPLEHGQTSGPRPA